ncbi:hypothetical protein RDI58_012850 [Solanum bulbocastanum]|uniref:Uncharacterized protein n=1 Tax=Solanum bulbocastanum TaxID=147425 RepID=A0AAN8TSG0_SOLBU
MWWDNWCEKGPLAKLYPDCMYNVVHSVKEYISHGNWNMDMLKNVLPDNIVHHIGNISIGDENHSDYAIWNLTQGGLYSSISARQSIREQFSVIVIWPNTYGIFLETPLELITEGRCSKNFQYLVELKHHQQCTEMQQITPIAFLGKFGKAGQLVHGLNFAGIGGISRDATGNLIMAFSVPALPTIKLKLWQHYMLPDSASKLDITNMSWNLILC